MFSDSKRGDGKRALGLEQSPTGTRWEVWVRRAARRGDLGAHTDSLDVGSKSCLEVSRGGSGREPERQGLGVGRRGI